jgi:hydrogenase maturation protease
VPEGAKLVDGGTAGMDVGFQMRGAQRVVIVDASSTGASPGTIYRVPGEELTDLPPLQGLHTHSFRWDHAIPFARWALGDACPTDITVFLIEAAAMEMGGELSEPVTAAMEQVIDLIERDFLTPLRPQSGGAVTVESPATATCAWTRRWRRAGFPPTRSQRCPATANSGCTRCGVRAAADCCSSNAIRPATARC